ncbi:site-specific DNA-methyltransferase [Winogradskyella algicola]|uniref:site-specific DNA-methyltransferase n=1 Tax=Winogradskyella algicola TaxID=2575815 RepID=UPI0011081901|nr:site-specific DNA-methyltransferase [Winogradskyella algicola]
MPLLDKDKDSKTNLIIKGDNIKVLKKLLPDFNKKIKCIYIDPPYNNGENYNHYNDEYTHQAWLDEMTKTLSSLKPFLKEDGSIWISIDDSEMHYLKIAADKVFGRHNFVTTIIWQQRTTRENRSVFSNNHEYILVYCINQDEFKKTRNLLPVTEDILKRYKNPDNDPRGAWQSVSANVQDGHAVASQYYDIIAPNGKIHSPPNGRCWCYNKERMENEILNNNIWFGKDGNGVPRIKKFLNGKSRGLTPETLWLGNIAGTNKSAKKHFLQMFPNEKVFDTPKPEELIKLILEIATNEDDIVLDCYLGSGTTISTAHKMNRQYIGIEKGNHITDIVLERMKLVVNGEQGGISKTINWKGGGDFTFKKIYRKKANTTS